MVALVVRVPLDDRVWTTIAFICEGALLSRATLSRLKLSSSCGERTTDGKKKLKAVTRTVTTDFYNFIGSRSAGE